MAAGKRIYRRFGE